MIRAAKAAKWCVKVLTSLCLGTILVFAVTISLNMQGSVASAASKLQPECVVHEVHLLGNGKTTMKCLKSRIPAKAGVTPYTPSEDRCQGNYIYVLEIDSKTTGAYCFFGPGDGYLGLSGIYNVSRIISLQYTTIGSPSCGHGWVMYYHPPFTAGTGIKFYFANCQYYDSSNSVFDGTIKITQVDLT